MKKPEWDECKGFSSSGTYKAGSEMKSYRLLEPGMKGSAYHMGNQIDIRINQVSERENLFEGEIVQIHTDNEISGDLEIGDAVIIPLEKVCRIDHDKL